MFAAGCAVKKHPPDIFIFQKFIMNENPSINLSKVAEKWGIICNDQKKCDEREHLCFLEILMSEI